MSDPVSLRLFRWAPTPSGPLHVGNVFSFLLTALLARRAGAELLLRIDDLDATRARPEHVEDIFRVLERLGLAWTRGPRDAAEFRARHSQADRQSDYRAAFEKARAENPARFYVCECSRSEIQRASAGDGRYPGTCIDKDLEWRPGRVWRCRVPEGTQVAWSDEIAGECRVDLAREMGDFVIFRKEELFSYQWVSLVEDLREGVTDVVRGSDLRASTAAQLFLGEGTTFAKTRFWHHPLIKQGEKKLSKSEGAASAAPRLAAPGGREKILGAFAAWIGWGPSARFVSFEDLVRCFEARKGDLAFVRGEKEDSQLDELL
jgi:glutamyl-tRNA synthetase